MVTGDDWFVTLPGLAWVSIEGADATTFLHGQFCADLLTVSPGEACLTAWCSPQGRIITTLFAGRTEEGWTLILPANLAAGILRRLRMFVLRARVELPDAPPGAMVHGLGRKTAMSLPRTAPSRIFPVAGDTKGGNRFLVCQSGREWGGTRAAFPPAIVELAPAVWLGEDVSAALPWVDAGTTELFLPPELELARWHGLSYSKGCYPGQEIVARLRSRGSVKRGLSRLHAPAGTETILKSGARLLDAAAKPVATVLYAGAGGQDGIPALAVVDFATPSHRVLYAEDGTGISVVGPGEIAL